MVSNRKAAYGLIRAEQAGIPTLYFPLKPYLDDGRGRATYDTDLAEQIRLYQPDLLVLAGWMHIFSAPFLEQFPRQVINLHPALPGIFPGKDAIQQTYEAFERGEVSYGGCMIHYVVPELDAGPTIAQAIVPIEPDDTLELFEARLHDAEHKLIVSSIQQILTGR